MSKKILFWLLIIPSFSLVIIFGFMQIIGSAGEIGDSYLSKLENWCFK